MRDWFHKLVRKLLQNRWLRRAKRRLGRPATLVRLELLEDRLVQSGLSDEVSSVVYASQSDGASLTPAGATVTLGEDSVSATGLSGPGFDRLMEALQALPSDAVELLPPPKVATAATAEIGTPERATGGESTSDVSGNVGVPALPASSQTAVTVSVAPSTVADSGPVALISIGTPQEGGGRVDHVTLFDPIALEVSPRTLPESALSGPGAVQALRSAFSDVGFPVQSVPGENGSGSWTPLSDRTDGSLLQLFAADREQSAFTTLVQRHEPSVLQVCTQVLGDSDRARDASQATFQVLARRAGSLDGQGPIGGWLSTVAYHLALRYRANDARRRQVERAAVARSADEDVLDPATDLERKDLRAVVGEELNKLPAKYRLPLIRHYFDGRTHAEVAREVGLPLGSIARRIEDALRRLRDRLITRGFPF